MKARSLLFSLLCGFNLGLVLSSSAQFPDHRPHPPRPLISGSNEILDSGTDGDEGACVNVGGSNEALVSGTAVVASLDRKIDFIPVTSGSGVSAIGRLLATERNGLTNGALNLSTKGLAADTYTVSATLLSDTSAITVGTFTVTDVSTLPLAKAGKAAIAKRNGKVAFGGKNGIAFPDGFDPFEIASLFISGSSGTLFAADLSSVSDGSYCARAPIIPGTVAPNASGFAKIKVRARNGAVNGVFIIAASVVPAKTTYTYSVDGVNIGTVTTTAEGDLFVSLKTGSTLPDTVNLFNVSTVAVHDESGNVIFSADF